MSVWRRLGAWTRDLLTRERPVSSGYAYPFSHSLSWNWNERPPFTLLTAELMAFDPKVTIALGARNGLIANAQVEVRGGKPEIMEFVAAQWRRIWSRESRRLLGAKKFGYAGFETMFADAPPGGRWAGKIVFDRLKDFHPRDVRPLVRDGALVGLSLRNVRGSQRGDRIEGVHPFSQAAGGGKVPIWAPKSLWITHAKQYGNYFGRSILENAYAPWWEKHQEGGAIKLRQLRMQKDAWVGDVFYYPLEGFQLENGEKISGRDLMREIGELRRSGGIIGLPAVWDSNGNRRSEYQAPQSVSGASQIFDYTTELDGEILEALETPGEVLEALSSGSGFSGRSVPLLALLAILQNEFSELLWQIDEQLLRPLVRINFAVEPDYEIAPRSLIDTIAEKIGQSSIGGDSMGSQSQNYSPSVVDPRELRPRSSFVARQFGEGYSRSDSLARVSYAHASRYRENSVLAPEGGALVGGIFYPEGRAISAAAMQFASVDERARLQTSETVGDVEQFVPRSGDRRSLMRELSLIDRN